MISLKRVNEIAKYELKKPETFRICIRVWPYSNPHNVIKIQERTYGSTFSPKLMTQI